MAQEAESAHILSRIVNSREFRKSMGTCENPSALHNGETLVGPYYTKRGSHETKNYCTDCAKTLAESNLDLYAL